MRLRTLLGILSTVVWFVAILSVAVPVASVMIPGAITVTPINSTATASGLQLSIPAGFDVSNRGFLPIDAVQLAVYGYYANGSQMFSLTSGPINLPPGATTAVDISAKLPQLGNITTPAQAQALQAEFADVTIKATASASLSGLLPISASADISVTNLFNSTSAGGTP